MLIALAALVIFAWAFGAARAADKNGVSPNAISLPKGPGSIEGLGESFQPHLNTGTAKYSIGLKLPSGVAGHQPSLTISYDGGGANGPLGFGWSLPARFVQRRTDRGIPNYGEEVGFERADSFINESREELVAHASGYYFLKNEGAFIRYRRVQDHWEGTLPNGVRMEFGLTEAGRIQDGDRIGCWLLERETDTRGNVIEYSYRSFPGVNDQNQKYLSSIRYGAGAPPWNNYHFAHFEYEARRDWFEDCRLGFVVRTGMRLRSVAIGTQGPTIPGHLQGDFDSDGTVDFLNRKYEFAYVNYAGTNSHWSLLGSVTPVGADGVSRLPPTSLGYAVSNPPEEISAEEHIIGADNVPAVVMDNPLAEFIDLNGDGLPDILKTELGGGAHQVSINRGQTISGSIQWASPVDVDAGGGTAWNYHLEAAATHLADMDGDGLADLVHKSAVGDVFYFRNEGRNTWGARSEMSAEETVPPAPFGEGDVRTGDFDFDKRTDVIQSVSAGATMAYRIWFNLGEQVYSRPVTVEPEMGFSFADSSVHIADFNGDRVPDVVRVQPETILVTAGLGYGRFTAPQTIHFTDQTLTSDQLSRVQLSDINGDGLSDLIIPRAGPGECWYWLNLGNYSFGERKRITGLPVGIGQLATTRWADLNGNGSTDYILADRASAPRLQTVDIGELLNGGTSPNLLTTINNGLGRITQVSYETSTYFSLQDALEGRPWTNLMPHSVTVVSQVNIKDTLGHEYITRFRYHDGYYDPVEKQFRGFSQVDQLELGESSAPTLVSVSYFDTGREYEAMKGKLLRFRLEQEDGKLFTEETTLYANPPRTLAIGIDGTAVTYAHSTGQRTRVSELGIGAERILESETVHDNFGNITRAADYGIVEAGNRSAFDDERITEIQYAINTNRWLLRLPSRSETKDEHGLVLSRVQSYYDDESFSGTNFGTATVGNLTLTRAWFDPSKPDAFIPASRMKYDSVGNVFLMLDPLAQAPAGMIDRSTGHIREITYDVRFRSYPVIETVHVGAGSEPLSVSAEYDEGFGTIRSATDYNANRTDLSYDSFGRISTVIKPGDSATFPTTEYHYGLGIPAGSGTVNYIETRNLDTEPGAAGLDKRAHYLISRVYSDGIGRALMTRQEAEPANGGGSPRVVVTGATTFNARQKPARSIAPFFSTRTGDSLDQLLEFENIEAPQWQGIFHEGGALRQLSLAEAHQSASSYDATLRVIQVKNAEGSIIQSRYEPLLVRNFDENDSDPNSPFFETPTVIRHDGLGRLIQTDEITRLSDDGIPGASLRSWSTSYKYDLNDNLIEVRDSQGNLKRMTFDGLNRRVLMQDPNAGTVTNSYDDAGNLAMRIDAKGQKITFAYDGANRVLQEDYHDEDSAEFKYGRTPDTRYHYDVPVADLEQGDGTRATATNSRGMITWVEDASGEEHFSYDQRGRIAWNVKRVWDPELNPTLEVNAATLVSYKTSTFYDAHDRITRTIYPDNDEVSYLYNPRGILAQIVGGPTGQIISNIVYTPSGQQQQLDYGNGVQTTHGYDVRQRLSLLRTLSPAAVAGTRTSLIDFAYTFDGVSNVRKIDDLRPVGTLAANDKRRNTQEFSYDDLYRLTRVAYNSPANASSNGGAILFRYDRIGNMLEQSSDLEQSENNLPITNLGFMEAGGTSGRLNRTPRNAGDSPGPHALTSIRKGNSVREYDYDANGNIKEIDGLKCTWDFRDRLVIAEDDKMRANYRYDFRGRRIIKRVEPKENGVGNAATSGRSETSFVTYPSASYEVRENDQPVKFIFSGSTRIAQVVGSLSTTLRVQRFRLFTGWNFLSSALSASNLLEQLMSHDRGLVVYKWNPQNGTYQPLSTETVVADTILCIRSPRNITLSITGTYQEPITRTLGPGPTYLASAGLETLRLDHVSPHLSAVWKYTSAALGWRPRVEGDLASISAISPQFGPGSVLFFTSTNSTSIPPPPPAHRIRYYHQDHLGSSALVTDADGALLEETGFYPFGVPRHEHRIAETEVPYSFTQKERDQETSLHYFEARFLWASGARFISCDPKFLNLELVSAADLTRFQSVPAKGNLYAYALNNPVRYVDPDGLDDLDNVSKGIDYASLANSFLEATDALEDNPGVKVAGKTLTVLSVGMKTAQFINNPNADTGGQLGYEATKTLFSVGAPPVGVILAVLDLAGVGPSKSLEAIEKTIQYNRQATKHYQEATKHLKLAEKIYRDGAQRAGSKLNELRPKVEKLERDVQQILENDRRTQAEIKRLERDIQRLKKQEKMYLERARKASEE